jgi:hypothetical protein
LNQFKEDGKSENCNLSVQEALALVIAWELGGYRLFLQPVGLSVSPPPVLLSLLRLSPRN